MTEKVLSEEKVLERLYTIKEEVLNAIVKNGRSIDDVAIMAVTKTRTPEIINSVINNGINLLGENRAQELLLKYDYYEKENIDIHFIGHLQTNKVKQILDKVSMIESIDRISLAEEVNKECFKIGKIMKVLVEVNIGSELSKSGVSVEALPDFVYNLSQLRNIKVCGLMTIPPICDEKLKIEQYFANMYKLFIDIKHKNIDNVSMDFLSMGMSGDYIEAIKHGSNIIRLGSAIFGQRLI